VAASLKNGNGPSGDRGSDQGNARSEHRRGDGGSNRGNSGQSTGNGGPGSGNPTRVPEPNTVTLFGAGVFGIAMWTKRDNDVRKR